MIHLISVALLLFSSISEFGSQFIIPSLSDLMRPHEDYGHFIGEVEAKWDANGRTMTLLAPFSYVEPTGRVWDAPTGSVTDGASIPRIGWTIIGGPFEGSYRDAAVVHDVACVKRTADWHDVHRMFYTAMLADKVNIIQAKIMYAAVYHFGPRWPVVTLAEQCFAGICTSVPVTTPPPPTSLTEDQFQLLKATIQAREVSSRPPDPTADPTGIAGTRSMSLDEIDAFGSR